MEFPNFLFILISVCFLVNVVHLQNYDPKCDNVPPTAVCRKVGDDYYMIDMTLHVNWFNAHRICRRYKGNLPTFYNLDELNRVGLMIIDAVERKEWDWFWSSINDLGTEGKFYSAETGKPIPFARWGKDEPNDAKGDEDCVHIFRDTRPATNTSFYMNDLNCASNRAYLLCRLE